MGQQCSISIAAWDAVAPGRDGSEAWRAWAMGKPFEETPDARVKTSRVPMMTGRRTSEGARFALEASLRLTEKHDVDALVFCSRHGEIQKNHQIQLQLAQGEPSSPTDFSMSVHNTASGLLTMLLRKDLPASSLAAGTDTFQQALWEVWTFLQGGKQSVLLVDFETRLPEIFRPLVLPPQESYAVAFVVTAGDSFTCHRVAKPDDGDIGAHPPQSHQFLRGFLRGESSFTVDGGPYPWQWSYREN